MLHLWCSVCAGLDASRQPRGREGGGFYWEPLLQVQSASFKSLICVVLQWWRGSVGSRRDQGEGGAVNHWARPHEPGGPCALAQGVLLTHIRPDRPIRNAHARLCCGCGLNSDRVTEFVAVRPGGSGGGGPGVARSGKVQERRQPEVMGPARGAYTVSGRAAAGAAFVQAAQALRPLQAPHVAGRRGKGRRGCAALTSKMACTGVLQHNVTRHEVQLCCLFTAAAVGWTGAHGSMAVGAGTRASGEQGPARDQLASGEGLLVAGHAPIAC